MFLWALLGMYNSTVTYVFYHLVTCLAKEVSFKKYMYYDHEVISMNGQDSARSWENVER